MLRHLASLAFLAAAACGGSGGGSETAQCDQQPGQGVSQPCCPAHGIDACGANLFCAAFDGRELATCYPERSRLDRTECTEDRHCSSGSCNTAETRCRSAPGTSCAPSIGCAPDPRTGGAYACVASSSTCRPVGDGSLGSTCATASDCESGVCTDNQCAFGGRTCGGGDGTGPCARDPGSGDCIACRVGSFDCRGECWETFSDVLQCADASGCTVDGGVTIACAIENCDAEICAHEACAETACRPARCY